MLLYVIDLAIRALVAAVARLVVLRMWAWLRRPRPREDYNTMKE